MKATQLIALLQERADLAKKETGEDPDVSFLTGDCMSVIILDIENVTIEVDGRTLFLDGGNIPMEKLYPIVLGQERKDTFGICHPKCNDCKAITCPSRRED